MKEETSEQSCLTLEQLEELYSGSGTPEERQHLDQCAACQAKLQEMKRLDAMVATAIQPPDGLSDRILAAVQRDKPGMIQGRLKLFRRLTYTAAAAILICALIAWGLGSAPVIISGAAHSSSTQGSESTSTSSTT